jgi:protein gp37
MGANTKIEWTDHTFNPWEGCTKVSPGCANCYAATHNARFGGGTAPNWGKGAPRRRTSAENWKQPLRWNREAHETHIKHYIRVPVEMVPRPRVFCASLADWLDDEVPVEWLADLLALIHATPNLDWLLLTKRPANWPVRIGEAALALEDRANAEAAKWVFDCRKRSRARRIRTWAIAEAAKWVFDWRREGTAPANVWIGTSVEDQTRADERIPALLRIPARVRFLSMEPLLGPVNLYGHFYHASGGEFWPDGTLPADAVCYGYRDGDPLYRRGLHWVIVGGESGRDARPMHPAWARSLRDQCAAAGVPFFFKQWGEWAPMAGDVITQPFGKGGSFEGDVWRPNQYEVGRTHMVRVGKAEAGRLLDGREWNEVPKGGAS